MKILLEFQSYCYFLIFQHFLRSEIGNEVDPLIDGGVEDLIIGPHIIKASPKYYCNSISSHS